MTKKKKIKIFVIKIMKIMIKTWSFFEPSQLSMENNYIFIHNFTISTHPSFC